MHLACFSWREQTLKLKHSLKLRHLVTQHPLYMNFNSLWTNQPPLFNNQSQVSGQFFLANTITPTNTAPRAMTAPPIRKGFKLSKVSQLLPVDSVAPCWLVSPSSAGFSGSAGSAETGSGFGGGAASFFSALEADFGAPLAFASMWEWDQGIRQVFLGFLLYVASWSLLTSSSFQRRVERRRMREQEIRSARRPESVLKEK